MPFLGRTRQAGHLLAFLMLLSPAVACQAAEYPVAYSTAPPSAAKAIPLAQHVPFPITVAVDGRAAGLIGDGRTDNTAAFKKLFLRPGQTIVIHAGDYLTGSIAIPSDTSVVLSPGVTIRDSGRLGPNDVLIRIVGNHIQLLGSRAVIRANRADYTSGEQRHGLLISGNSDVTIRGIESSGHGGDGFNIGGPHGRPSTDITIIDCVATNNRRQGLSITNARRVDVVNSSFSGTKGTRPEFGVDLEPDVPGDLLDGISLVGIRTSANHGGGLLLWLDQLNATSVPVDITIQGHTSSNEAPAILTSGPASIPGVVRYIRIR